MNLVIQVPIALLVRVAQRTPQPVKQNTTAIRNKQAEGAYDPNTYVDPNTYTDPNAYADPNTYVDPNAPQY